MFKTFFRSKYQMSSDNTSYRDRLAMLEKDLYTPQKSSFTLLSSIYIYPIVAFILFILLSIFTPSFLYKKHKKKYNKSWGMIIFIWLLLSIIICGGIFYYLR